MNRDEKRLKKQLAQFGKHEERKQRQQASKLRKQSQTEKGGGRRPKLTPRNWEKWTEENEERFEKLGRSGGDSLDHWVRQMKCASDDGRDWSSIETALVLWVGAGRCEVWLDGEVVDCRIPPALARTQRSDLAVGDQVSLDWPEDPTATPTISGVAPRRTWLARRDPHSEHLERVLIANVDSVVIVGACGSPPLRPGLIDRFLVAIERGGAEPVICVNKIDLLERDADREDLERTLSPYRELGLPIFECSAHGGQGLEALKRHLTGQLAAFVGHSGVGKSSLLNGLRPELSLDTGGLREGDGAGRHTTSASTLYELGDATRIIDTPGIRELGLGRLTREELQDVFTELLPLAADCRYPDCRHTVEPDCAVQRAVEAGQVSEQRYKSYRRLLEG
ncbi:MAG: ribosome small subunit-dependent GTPase A [Planctomycetota bacterium]